VFDLADLSGPEISILKKLSLCAPVPVSKLLIKQWLGLQSLDTINDLAEKGWLISYGKELFLYNVISEILLYKYQEEITFSHYQDLGDDESAREYREKYNRIKKE
jgi:hypothetical protein